MTFAFQTFEWFLIFIELFPTKSFNFLQFDILLPNCSQTNRKKFQWQNMKKKLMINVSDQNCLKAHLFPIVGAVMKQIFAGLASRTCTFSFAIASLLNPFPKIHFVMQQIIVFSPLLCFNIQFGYIKININNIIKRRAREFFLLGIEWEKLLFCLLRNTRTVMEKLRWRRVPLLTKWNWIYYSWRYYVSLNETLTEILISLLAAFLVFSFSSHSSWTNVNDVKKFEQQYQELPSSEKRPF